MSDGSAASGVAGPAAAAESISDDRRSMGRGHLPPELARFNWGAYLLAPVWALANERWLFFAIWLGLRATLRFASWPAERIGHQVFVVSALGVQEGVFIWLGCRANALRWGFEGRKRAHAGARPLLPWNRGASPTIEQYLSRQANWMVIGVVFLALALVPEAAFQLGVRLGAVSVSSTSLTPALLQDRLLGWTVLVLGLLAAGMASLLMKSKNTGNERTESE